MPLWRFGIILDKVRGQGKKSCPSVQNQTPLNFQASNCLWCVDCNKCFRSSLWSCSRRSRSYVLSTCKQLFWPRVFTFCPMKGYVDYNDTYRLLLCSLSHGLRSIYEPRHEISSNVVCVTSKASDQPAHTSLWIFRWLLSNWPNIIWSF